MKNNKGITIIALIITIIVMLILAGVAINMVIGENGVITKAEEAKKVQEEARSEENIDIGILAAVAEGKGKIETVDQLKAQFKAGYNITDATEADAIEKGYIIEDLNNEKYYYVDENGQKQNLEILNSTENGKKFSWTQNSSNKEVKDLKFLNSEYEGKVKFPDYIKYGNELYQIKNMKSHIGYKFSEVIMPIKIYNATASSSGKSGMFRECKNLNKITINNIEDTKIAGFMFQDCQNLKEVVFNGNDIIYILGNAFYGCTSLESIKLPKELNTLATGVFKDCINLKYVYFGENISNIVPDAFFNCKSLGKIQINKTVEEIRNILNAENLIEKNKYTKGKVYDKYGDIATFK